MKRAFVLLLIAPLLMGFILEVEETHTLEIEGQTLQIDITRLTSSSVTLRIQPINQNPLIFVNETASVPIGGGRTLQLTPVRFTTQSVRFSYNVLEPATQPSSPSRPSSPDVPHSDDDFFEEESLEEQPLVLDVERRLFPYIFAGVLIAIAAFALVALFVLKSSKKEIPLDSVAKEPVVKKSEVMKETTVDKKLEPSKITSFDEYDTLRKDIEKKF